MKMSDIIQGLLKEEEDCQRKCQEIAERNGVSQFELNMSDTKQVKSAAEQWVEGRKVEEYLKQFDLDTLRKVEALVYLGRDGGTYQHQCANINRLNQSKDAAANTIASKGECLKSYLDSAIEALRGEGKNINEL